MLNKLSFNLNLCLMFVSPLGMKGMDLYMRVCVAPTDEAKAWE